MHYESTMSVIVISNYTGKSTNVFVILAESKNNKLKKFMYLD